MIDIIISRIMYNGVAYNNQEPSYMVYFINHGNKVKRFLFKQFTKCARINFYWKTCFAGFLPKAIAVAMATTNTPQSILPSCF